MWPPRKMMLVVSCPQQAEGLRGFLSGLEIETEVWCVDDVYPEGTGNTGPDDFALGCTEALFWPDLPEKAREMPFGIPGRDIREFLHTLWQGEHILPVDTPYAPSANQPLLYRILQEAEFEPSLIWPTPEGEWMMERGRGVHWVVSAPWLASLIGPLKDWEQAGIDLEERYTWMVRPDRIDFYADYPRVFIGSLSRRPVQDEENGVCESIVKALSLGIPWSVIRRTLDDGREKSETPDQESLPEFEWHLLLERQEDRYQLAGNFNF